MKTMKLRDVFTAPPLIHRMLWWLVRAILLAWGIYGLYMGSKMTFVQSLFCIGFSHLWDMFQFFGHDMPIGKVTYRAQTALNLFILFASILGDLAGLYDAIGVYDLIMHLTSGVLVSWFVYDLTFIFQRDDRPPEVVTCVAFALLAGGAVACWWEMYEFIVDTFGGTNMQCSTPFSDAGLIDTMTDIYCGVGGSVIGTVLTALQRTGIIGRNRKARRAAHLQRYAKPQQPASDGNQQQK